MREKSGTSAAGLKFHPPSATAASSTRPIRAAKIGSAASSAVPAASPSEDIMECGSSSRCGSMAMKRRTICDILPASAGTHRNQRDAAADHGREVGQLPRARHLAAFARLLQASLRRLFGAFAAALGFSAISALRAAGAPTSSATARQRAVDETRNADHEAVEPDEQHEEPATAA